MTAIKLSKEHAAIIDAFKAFNTNVKAQNLRKVQELTLMLSDKRVYEMMNAQGVTARDFDVALYTSEKAIKMMHALTRDHVNVDDLEYNTFCAVKSVINAISANETFTREDARCIIFADAAKKRAHVYVRARAISADAQVNYTFSAIKMMKLIDSATLKARECTLLTLATEKLKEVAK